MKNQIDDNVVYFSKSWLLEINRLTPRQRLLFYDNTFNNPTEEVKFEEKDNDVEILFYQFRNELKKIKRNETNRQTRGKKIFWHETPYFLNPKKFIDDSLKTQKFYRENPQIDIAKVFKALQDAAEMHNYTYANWISAGRVYAQKCPRNYYFDTNVNNKLSDATNKIINHAQSTAENLRANLSDKHF